MRLLHLFILVCALSAPAYSSASSFPDQYDVQIRKAVKTFRPGIYYSLGWEIQKAQLYQESRLNTKAVSPVGAAGIAQFMPGTWGDVARKLGQAEATPFEADIAIQASAYYMARIEQSWASPRPLIDRQMLALASYNAGAGNLYKAQTLCGGGNLYKQIIPCLPDVTGEYSQETITYVRRILRYWIQMKTEP